MTNDTLVELSAKLQTLFDQYGVVGFGGILFEANGGLVLNGNGAADDSVMTGRCDTLHDALTQMAFDVFFDRCSDGTNKFKPLA